jgi:nitrile hydratase accessory protein
MSTGTRLADVDAALAGRAPLPRDNGELVFEEPWQGRVLGMGVVTLERLGLSWIDFRDHLAAAIARHGYDPAEPSATAYYTAFVEALESLLAEHGVRDA